MTDYNVGDAVSITAYCAGRRPSWLSWTANDTLAGAAKLPSGYRRVCHDNGGVGQGTSRIVNEINVLPVTLPSTDAPWRCAVFKSDGAYAVMDGLTGVPSLGTPKVRLQADGPARAEISLPIVTSAGCPSSSTFSGWSDGSTGAISRGQELTVEYRDADSGNLVLVFRGQIYQVDKGESIKLTAYDRLMDLYLFSDQYQSTQGHQTEVASYNKSTSGTTYSYTFDDTPGSIDSAYTIDRLTIDATAQMNSSGGYNIIAHQLPKDGTITPKAGATISRLRAAVHASFLSGGANYHLEYVYARFYLLQKTSSGLVVRATSSDAAAVNASSTAVAHAWDATLEINVSGWTIGSTASEWYIGVTTWAASADGRAAYSTLKASTTRYTTSGLTYYTSSGGSWSVLSDSNLPEIALTFTRPNSNISPSLLTTSGSTVSLDASSIPTVSGTYTNVDEYGVGLVLSYFITDAATISGIVEDLIKCAGLLPEIDSSVNMGNTTYYTSSTYDYLTCINELIRAANMMATADTQTAGKIHILPKHTLDETPSYSFSTAPGSAYTQAVVSHNLTAHWMAEKATVAYLAEDATTSGLPVALESDDALLTNPLSAAFPAPLRQVIADRSLSTHDLQANAAGGKMIQLHTNVIEGSITLAGYYTGLWDIGGAKAGGVPVGLDVPEASASGTALPTEIILGDGVTQVSLNNIRTADRSELANAMGLTADAISNGSGELPETVYIFAKVDSYDAQETGHTKGTVSDIYLTIGQFNQIHQYDTTKIKVTEDNAGYIHYCAIFEATESGLSPDKDIFQANVSTSNGSLRATIDNPKRALGGQNIHVDVRVRKA